MAADQGNQFAICAKGQMCILRCVTCDGQLELDKGARSTLNLEGRNGTKGGLEKKERQAKVAPPSVNEPLAPSSLHHPPREIRLRASLAIF